jgi:diadenosine tetraphosphate (Ap4A) HIT family hydrolase
MNLPPVQRDPACPLCVADGGHVLWRDALLRVVAAEEPGYPIFVRVIAAKHQREMTSLSEPDRSSVMRAVFAVEAVMLRELAPHKINLASFGNMVPHLHWHVIPRFADDRHFPNPVWGAVTASDQGEACAARMRAARAGFETALTEALTATFAQA